ncbi:Hypothetical protein A7982_09896 [Minicystis rosea]|nr:Hypothetical protein A7982_09896 [Minicystis rosea]
MSTASPAYPIATQLLVGKHLTLAPHIALDRHSLAIAKIGTGLDHLAGEMALALSDDRLEEEEFSRGVVFTDRRVFARVDNKTIDVPYPAIQDVRARSGMLQDDLDITAYNRVFTLAGIPAMQPTAAFLQALTRFPPGYRVPPPRPLSYPTPDDPTGGAAARHDIWSRDVRVLPLLGMAIEGHRQGRISAEIGADLVTRAMLFDRTLAYGRGAREGWWTSALGGPDLAYAFSRMIGETTGSWQENQARCFEFRIRPRGPNVGAAVSTAVGLLALGVLGVGWVSTPGRALPAVRVKIVAGTGSCGFALCDEKGAPLSQEWAPLVKALFEGLSRIEGRMLIQRAAFGWDMPPERLDEIPVEALFRGVAERIGEIDIGIFFPKQQGK